MSYSKSHARDKRYQALVEAGVQEKLTVQMLAQAGCELMRKAKLHPHFHPGRSLLANALTLTFFALGLPPEYKSQKYLQTRVSAQEAEKIVGLFERRIADRVPLEYITHEAKYLGRDFYVNENVLVPRSLMNTRFKDFLKAVPWTNHQVLDLCTGSGCIGITLALMDERIKVDLADISPGALEVAAVNVKRYDLGERSRCIRGDLFENIRESYDLIISNPPYVADGDYQPQPAEVKSEPALALKGGKDGLDLIHQILRQAKAHLKPEGLLIMEVGYPAAKRLKKVYPRTAFKWLVCRGPWIGEEHSEKESLFDLCMNKLFGTHSILICRARDLPA